MPGDEYTCFSTLSCFQKLVPKGGHASHLFEGDASKRGVRRFSSSSSTLSLTHRGLEKGLADLKTAELALTKAILEYKEPSTSSFRELACGVFQAEGCVSA